MSHMKINILFDFDSIKAPWKSSQFLRDLRNFFEQEHVYTTIPDKADAILFYNHYCIDEVIKIKRLYPNKIFIHKIDGPLRFIDNKNDKLDDLIFTFNHLIADGTVFQSEWSKIKCFEHGLFTSPIDTVILNAPDPSVFFKKEKNISKKKKIISICHSPFINKGIDILIFLDENLDFNKFEMTCVGDSPVTFKHIRHLRELTAREWAEELVSHDFFLAPSIDDPCPVSLIEAFKCGLPALVRDSGAYPEILGNSGLLFNGTEDIISSINTLSEQNGFASENEALYEFDLVSHSYLSFMAGVYSDAAEDHYWPKKINFLKSAKLKKIRKSLLLNENEFLAEC